MSLAASLLLIAQSAAPAVGDVPKPAGSSVAVPASATVTIRRAAVIRVSDDGDTSVESATSANEVQRSRDEAGTVWIEFS